MGAIFRIFLYVPVLICLLVTYAAAGRVDPNNAIQQRAPLAGYRDMGRKLHLRTRRTYRLPVWGIPSFSSTLARALAGRIPEDQSTRFLRRILLRGLGARGR